MYPQGYICLSEVAHLRSSTEGEKYIYCLFPKIPNYKSSFKISVGFHYFTQPFFHETFLRYILICRNAEGVQGQRKVGKWVPLIYNS